MTTAASLNVLLGMNTANFSHGVQSASHGFKSLLSAAAVMGAVHSLTEHAIEGIVESLREIPHVIMEAVESAAHVHVLAEELGASAERLSELQYAARLTETDVDTLNLSVEKFAVNLGKAMKGGAAAKPFADLGLDPQKLGMVDTATAVEAVLDVVRDLPSGYDQAAAMAEIFGKKGVKLLNLARLSKEEFAAMIQEGKGFGSILSDTDIEKLADANREILKMKEAWKGVGNALAAEAAPAMSLFTEYWTNFFKGSEDRESWTHWFFSTFGGDFKDALDQRASDMERMQKNAKLLEGDKGKHGPLGEESDFGAESISKAADSAEKLMAKFREDSALAGFEGRMKEVQKIAIELAGSDPAMVAALTAQAQKLDEIEAKNKRIKETHEEALKIAEEMLDPWEKYNRIIERLNEMNRNGEISPEDSGAIAAKAVKDRDKALADADPFKHLKEELQTPLDKINEKRKQIQDALAANAITPEQAQSGLNQLKLDELEQRKHDLEALYHGELDHGPQRPAALLAGTAAAFSASFGQKPTDKVQADILEIDRQTLILLRQKLDPPAKAVIQA